MIWDCLVCVLAGLQALDAILDTLASDHTTNRRLVAGPPFGFIFGDVYDLVVCPGLVLCDLRLFGVCSCLFQALDAVLDTLARDHTTNHRLIAGTPYGLVFGNVHDLVVCPSANRRPTVWTHFW